MNKEFLSRAIFFYSLIFSLFAIQLVIRQNSDINHDIAWTLYVAEKIEGIKHIYSDFIEVNPPLIFWLSRMVFWISQITGLSIYLSFNLFCFLIAGVSLTLVNRYITRAFDIPPPQSRLFIVFVTIIFLFFPGFNFGQREHLLFMLTLPWFLLRSARIKTIQLSRPHAISVGLISGIGFAIKPQSLLVIILIEISLAVITGNFKKSLSPENISLASTLVLYFFLIYLLNPDYIDTIVPLGKSAYVSIFGADGALIIYSSIPTLFFAFIALLMVARLGDLRHPLSLIFLVSSFGFILFYFIQLKGFSYHLLPAKMSLALLATTILFSKNRSKNRSALFLKKLLAGLFLAANINNQFYRSHAPYFEELINNIAPNSKTIFIASTNLSKIFPLVTRNDFIWASRFPAQWLIPYISTKWASGEMPNDFIAKQYLSWTITDFMRFKPDIVFIDISSRQDYVPNKHFDYLAFWQLDQRFANFWVDYELKLRNDDYAIYTKSSAK